MSHQQEQQTGPINIFISYAREDQQLYTELKQYLSPLRRRGLITLLSGEEAIPGTDMQDQIRGQLNAASLILLLMSPEFMSSEYCTTNEMLPALERYKAGKALLIPVLLRPTDWQQGPLKTLVPLPQNARPVTDWPDREEAFGDIVRGISRTVTHLQKKQQTKNY